MSSKLNIFSFLGFGKKSPMTAADLMSEDAKAAAAWIETVNPLRGMTSQRMQNLYDASRNGDTVHLQWLYNEIEKVDPTLLICAQRRRGALASLDWTIKTRSERRVRGFDAKLAEEQSAALEAAFGDAEMANFNDAVEHLAGAFFRGFAHVLPVWSADGLSIRRFETLDQWNFCRDIQTGTWYWNPEANAYTDYSSCRPIPDGEVVAMVAPYHIDYPAMTIYLRSAVGEKGWAKFVERFGIPPCILTLPSDIPNDQIGEWRRAAEKVAEGGSGAMPNGTGVNFCDGARGINPFKDFIHNQRELVVLMSTGGMLTSLTEAGSGTLAGNAHADTWAEIRRMDSAKIGSVINRDLAGRILDRAFPGKPHLAYFAFATEAVPSPGEVFEDAGKARTAGYLVDKAQLEEMTGYKLEKIEEPAAPKPTYIPLHTTTNKVVGNSGSGTMENSSVPLTSTTTTPPTTTTNADLLKAFAADTNAAGKAVAELLKNPTQEAAASLLAKLDTLMPDDPATAAVIAEAMAKEFGVQVKNAITNPCPKCHHQLRADGGCTHCEMSANHDKGKSALEKAISDKADVLDAMSRKSIGNIDFVWGTPGKGADFDGGEGISHILAKHPDAAQQITGVIAFGDVYDMPSENKYYIVKGRRMVVLRKREKMNSYVVTGFKADDPNKVRNIRKEGKLLEKGE